eukprot:682609-Pyramimonas_sp.AAC.1
MLLRCKHGRRGAWSGRAFPTPSLMGGASNAFANADKHDILDAISSLHIPGDVASRRRCTAQGGAADRTAG